MALLGKWWWRFRVEHDAFWVKVIKSIHGRDGGLGNSNSFISNRGSIWNGIRNIDKEFYKINLDFSNSFVKVVSDGSETLFWEDKWLGEQPLHVMFNRLYRLETSKDATVRNRIIQQDSSFSLNWNWVRPPAGRTATELSHLQSMLEGFRYTGDGKDHWEWSLNNNKPFYSCILRGLIDDILLPSLDNPTETMRNNLIPQKISVFLWRAQRNRFSVRIELDKKRYDLDSIRCPICDNALESIDHIFLECGFTADVWNRLFRWRGISIPIDINLSSLLQNSSQFPSSNTLSRIWQATTWAIVALVCSF
ncbi:uncharacterized protein [Rutidosis leptorrhynchoides]|uniref:uncharacterized protein n=1 Tax=Rutidosis leptorrhynchoides TaxID=125765 RepID=UPI003A98E8F7